MNRSTAFHKLDFEPIKPTQAGLCAQKSTGMHRICKILEVKTEVEMRGDRAAGAPVGIFRGAR